MCAFQKILQSLLFIMVSLLAGCGGGSGGGTTAGIGGTGQIASGTITGFGSIFLNGIKFEGIDTATCVIDGIDSTGINCQTGLQLGMVVEINGDFNSTTGLGNATQVVYNDDVDGPVSGIAPTPPGPSDVTRTFSVLNTPVLIDSASTKFLGSKGFDDLADGDVVEVSGFFDSTGLLHATYVNTRPAPFVENSTQVEVKGNVSGTVPANGASTTGDTFVVTGFSNTSVNVTIAGTFDLDDMPGGIVQNDDFVEVRGTYDSVTNTVTADRVQLEDSAVGNDGDEVSIEGLITDFNDPSDFKVDGLQVDAGMGAEFSPATLETQLADGIKVEVEGTISGTTLIAEKVESRDNDIKVEARVSEQPDENAGTLTVQFGTGDTLVILVDSQTQMEDKIDPTQNLNLGIINVDDFLEIRGFLNPDPMIDVTASEIRRNTLDDDVLQGPVDSVVPDTSVTILGVLFSSDTGTEYEVNNGPSDRTTFYTNVKPGCIVKVQDGDNPTPPDGFADEMDLEGTCP